LNKGRSPATAEGNKALIVRKGRATRLPCQLYRPVSTAVSIADSADPLNRLGMGPIRIAKRVFLGLGLLCGLTVTVIFGPMNSLSNS